MSDDRSVELWLLLGLAGWYIRVEISRDERAAPVHPAQRCPRGGTGDAPTSTKDEPLSSGSDATPPPAAVTVTVPHLASFLHTVLQVEFSNRHDQRKQSAPSGAGASGGAARQETEEAVEVDVPSVQMDFFDVASKSLVAADHEVSCDSRLILFCQPAEAETTLASIFRCNHRPNPEPVPAEQASLSVINNLLTSLQAVKRVADRTFTHYQHLSSSVDVAMEEAQAKVAALHEHRNSTLLMSSIAEERLKGKDRSAKQLKAGVKVAAEALEKAGVARAMAHDILSRQDNLLTLISLDITFPDDMDGKDGGGASANANLEKETYLRACVMSALTVLRACLRDAERLAELLDSSSGALGLVDMVYERFEQKDRRPAAVARVTELLRRRAAWERAVQALWAPLEAARRELMAETDQFVCTGDFALVPPHLRDAVRAPLPSLADTFPNREELPTSAASASDSSADAEELLKACGIRIERADTREHC